MKKVELEETNVISAYEKADQNGADQNGKDLLKKLFPSVKFKKEITKYTDINEFEDALELVRNSHTGIGDLLIREYDAVTAALSIGIYYLTLVKIRIIVFAINGCDESFPNWDDNSQQKYYPWFYLTTPGAWFRFFFSYYVFTFMYFGSRLVFKDEERCKYVSEHKNFMPLYKIIFNQ